jgi:PAS domain S-box-containing protein
MHMIWAAIIILGVLVSGGLVAAGLAFYAWRRRDFPGAEVFATLNAALAVWTIGYALELSAGTLQAKLIWSQIEYVGIVLTPVAWFMFASHYTGQESWASRNPLALLLIPIITISMTITNPLHGWQWASYTLGANGLFHTFKVLAYGPWWWIHFIYSYILILWGTILMVRALRGFPHIYRWQFVLLLCGVFLPWLGNILYLSGLNPLPDFDLSPFAFTLSTFIFWIGITRFRIFDLAPVIQGLVSDHMEAILVVDRKDRLVDFNPLAVSWFGFQKNQVLGLPVVQAFREWQQVDVKISSAIETMQTISIVIKGIRRYFDLQIQPLFNEHQRLTGRLLIFHDITSDRLAEDALALAQVKTEFLAKVSHELRTPLTSILGVTEMLEYGIYGNLNKEQKNALRIIFDSTARMNRLVDDLLEQARLEQGNFRLNITEFDLQEILDKLRDQMMPRARAKGIEFSVETLPGAPAQLRTDPLRLYQVLNNLVENAIKYTPNGKIWVRVNHDGVAPETGEPWVVFQVQDTGIGIEREMQSIIYDAFRQISQSIDGAKNSFGLGLSIVKQLVTLMGGEVTCESEVGKGSLFQVKLPVTLAPQEAPGYTPKEETYGSAAGRHH